MAEYISTFPTGFEGVAARRLSSFLPGAQVTSVHSGLLRYRYPGNGRDVANVPFFSNSYQVLRFFQGRQASFAHMVFDVASKKLRYPIRARSFRVRFSQGNQFVKVDRALSQRAEGAVIQCTPMRLDRLSPETELWYAIREEGFGFYGQLVARRAATEKNLNKGELRPEVACLMCLCADHPSNAIVMDPFAGFGAIPAQLLAHFPFCQLIAGDLDQEKAGRLKRLFANHGKRVRAFRGDALAQATIQDGSVDVIITDPPWGYYEQISDMALFYRGMLKEFRRVLKANGTAVILSARKEEMTAAIRETGLFSITDAIHTLVNGKKAAVYVLAANQPPYLDLGV